MAPPMGVLAVQRALRPAQHLDPLQVEHLRIDIGYAPQVHIVHEHGHGVVRAGPVVVGGCAAQRHDVLSRRERRESEPRNARGDAGEFVYVRLLNGHAAQAP